MHAEKLHINFAKYEKGQGPDLNFTKSLCCSVTVIWIMILITTLKTEQQKQKTKICFGYFLNLILSNKHMTVLESSLLFCQINVW